MRYLVYVLLFVVCLFVAAASFILVAAPVDLIRDKMIAAVKEQTGRDLIVDGKTSLKFYPSVGLKITKVSLTPPPGMTGEAFVVMGGMEVDIPIMPLLRREVAVDRFILTRPEFEFRIDQRGRQSWDFASAGRGANSDTDGRTTGGGSGSTTSSQANNDSISGTARTAGTQSSTRSTDGATDLAGSDPVAGLRGFRLGDVRIVDGVVRYIDERTGTQETLNDINLTLNMEAIDKPFLANGRLTWKGQKLPFRARLSTPESLMAKTTTEIDLALDAALIKASLKGTLETAGNFRLSAATQAEISSLRKLAAWLGTKLPPADGFGSMIFSGNLAMQPGVIALNGGDLTIDGAHAKGDVVVETDRARPYIRAKLALDHLNVNTYMPSAGAGGAKGGKAKGKDSKAGKADDPIAGLLNQDSANTETAAESAGSDGGQNAKGAKRAGGGWSRARIDFSGLQAVDADIAFQLDKLTYQEIKAGRSRLLAKLNGGLLEAEFAELNLYGGSGSGRLSLDSRQAAAQVSTNFTINRISALPLMKDATAFDWIDGNGDLSFDLSGSGQSQFQIVSSLAGSGQFTFSNGAIVGVNIPGMVRGLTRGQFSGWSRNPAEKTDFSSLSASFTIAKGIASNQDFQLVGPLIRIAGAGKIDLPRQRINYSVRPKVVASLEGQGASANARGLEIPFKVQGPWASPNFVPDLEGMLSNPSSALDAISQIGGGKVDAKSIQDKLRGAGKGSKFESIIENALGGGSGKKNGNQKDPAAALKNLLGQ